MPEKLSDFWDQKVVKSDKHFVETLSQEKINRMKSRVDELLFSQLDFSKIQTVLDWGCGGGLFAKILSEKTKVIIADISQESINKTRSYTGKDLPAILIPEKLSDIQIPEKNIDLIFCHTVIHHFPSYEYWLEVFDIWTQKIRPNYFALQIKIEDKTIARENYFHDKNYLNALYLNENEFVSLFKKAGWNVLNADYKINVYTQPDLVMKVGYFVFEKN